MKAICLASLCLLLSGCSMFDSGERPFSFPEATSSEQPVDPDINNYPSFVREPEGGVVDE